jgi:hypothetical protein
MKKNLILLGLVLGFLIQGMAQTKVNDLAIVGDASNDANMRQIEKRFQHRGNAYFIVSSGVNAIEQILAELEKKGTIEDLHIFVKSTPNELIFCNSTILSSNNVMDFSKALAGWKPYISGKVLIHSFVPFTLPAGSELRKSLETLSGLEFQFKK